MKTIKHPLIFIAFAIVAIIVWSCTKQEIESNAKGTFSLSFEDSDLKSDVTLTDVYVSIENDRGERIYDMKRLTLLSLLGSGGYITENIELLEGTYVITAFMVASGSDIIYLTPREGSEKAHLVTMPLPIKFTVEPNRTTHVIPEVVRIDNCVCPPEEFGYVSFSFVIVDEPQPPVYNLNGMWEQCITRPYMDPDSLPVQGVCYVVDIYQENEYIALYNEETGEKMSGYIKEDIINFKDEEGIYHSFQIIDNDYIVSINEECLGCPITTLKRIPQEQPCGYNFYFGGGDGFKAEIIVLALGEKEIYRQKLVSGINTLHFENVYDYYTVYVSSPLVKCMTSGYTIYHDELEEYFCESTEGFYVSVCGGDEIIYDDSLLLDEISTR